MALPDVQEEQQENYRVLRVTVPTFRGTTTSRVAEPLKLSGDTVTVLELVGSQTVGISFNVGGQYVPVREGDTIKRKFSQLRVRSFQWGSQIVSASGIDAAAVFIPTVEVLLLVSYGDMLTRAPLKPGFTCGSPKFRGVAPATGDTIFNCAVNTGTSFPFTLAPLSLLKWGGTMMIRNRSTTTSLFLFDGVPGVFSMDASIDFFSSPDLAWEIMPGEVLTLDSSSRLSQNYNWGNIHPTVFQRSLCIAGGGAPCEFTVWLSGLGDFSDPDASGQPLTKPAALFDPTSYEYDGRP